MNIMLISVTQRTREIGVRMAVGATEWDVQLQFLSEAVALSMLGAVLGLLAGVFASAAVEHFFEFPTDEGARYLSARGWATAISSIS